MRTPLLVSCLLATLMCALAPLVLGQTRPAANANTVAGYIAELKSPDQATRLNAAEAITSLGPQAKAAVPDLIPMLDWTASVEQIAAAIALAKIGPDAAPAIPALQKLEATGDDNTKQIAHLAIEAISPSFGTILMDYLQSPYLLAA